MTTEIPENTEPADFDRLKQSLGSRIRMARAAKLMTKKALATRLGVKKSTITAWEEDRRNPRVNRLQLMSGILDVSIMWLMSGIDNGTHRVEESLNRVPQLPGSSNELKELKELLKSALKRVQDMEQQLNER